MPDLMWQTLDCPSGFHAQVLESAVHLLTPNCSKNPSTFSFSATVARIITIVLSFLNSRESEIFHIRVQSLKTQAGNSVSSKQMARTKVGELSPVASQDVHLHEAGEV